MSHPIPHRTPIRRGARGVLDGAALGLLVGVGDVAIDWLRGEWPGGGRALGIILIFTACVAAVFGLGQWIAGRIGGAWIGAFAGCIAGMLAAQQWFPITWLHELSGPNGSGTTTATIGDVNVVQAGLSVGWLLGAILGALADRLVRGHPDTPGKDDEPPSPAPSASP